MPNKIIITSPEHLRRAQHLLSNLDTSKVWEFSLKLYRRNRSKEQNERYWAILKVISEYIGDSSEELHETFKEKFLVPILIANPDKYTIFAEKVDTVKELRKRGLPGFADKWKTIAIKDASTTELNTKHFSEYMDSIEHYALHEFGISIPPPPEPQI